MSMPLRPGKRFGFTFLATAIAVPAAIFAVPAFSQGATTAEPGSRRPQSAVTATQPPRKPLVHAQILAFNDFHGNLEPAGMTISAATGTPHGKDYVKAGGAAYLAAHLARAKKQNPASVVVSAGDLVGGSPMISGLYHDEPTIEVMNRILDVDAVGNHEFDEGTTELRRLMGRAKFDVLAANVVERATNTTIFPPYVLKKVGDATVGFIGTTTTDTTRLAPVQGMTDVRFENEAATITRLVPELRAKGADAVVVLTHSGAGRSSNGVNGCQGVKGAAVNLTKKLEGTVDAVVSAHTHNSYTCRIEGTVLTGGSSYGRLFSTIKLTIDPNKHEVTASSARNAIVDHEVKPDQAVAKIVKKWHDTVAPKADKKAGTLKAAATRTPTTAGESALGDLVADAELASTKQNDAQIALVNRGFIRADVARGPVTAGEIWTSLPFEHRLVTMTLTGAQLEKVLEEQFCSGDPEEDEPRDPVEGSRGFSYSFSGTAECGDKIRLKDVELNGRSVGKTTEYRVTVNDFFAPGLNGFPTMAKGSDRVTGAPETTALAGYLKTHDRAPATGSRIRVR